jgi:hypothetical protein
MGNAVINMQMQSKCRMCHDVCNKLRGETAHASQEASIIESVDLAACCSRARAGIANPGPHGNIAKGTCCTAQDRQNKLPCGGHCPRAAHTTNNCKKDFSHCTPKNTQRGGSGASSRNAEISMLSKVAHSVARLPLHNCPPKSTPPLPQKNLRL